MCRRDRQPFLCPQRRGFTVTLVILGRPHWWRPTLHAERASDSSTGRVSWPVSGGRTRTLAYNIMDGARFGGEFEREEVETQRERVRRRQVTGRTGVVG